MANEIWHNFPSGNSLDAYVFKKSDDKVFVESDGGDTFEDWVNGNVLTYDIPMTDNGGDYYSVDFPAVITNSTLQAYRVAIAVRAGGSAAVGDIRISQGEIQWDGISEVDIGTINITQTSVTNIYEEDVTAPPIQVINL
ncbi:hypothetical protein LCGC14_1560480 [marine sediment metagenome]|uniref:Uncharacterized protein n=1 Tax=marine sediment metagenome TaxID=412755 RepID=A0A0F9L406_9ZZZZ